jgi:FkbM family methyltransferase
MQKRIIGAFAALARFFWRRLSLAQRARFIEHAPTLGVLDWAGGRIQMRVRSYQGWRRLRACATEPHTVAWIEEDFKPGNVLYDIGASTGPYALIAASVTQNQATIYAFEPLAASFAELLENIVLNKATSVLPFRVALGRASGFTRFSYASFASGTTKHIGLLPPTALGVRRNLGTGEVCSELMYAWSLDDFAARALLLPPTHMKIDVDGSEEEVLVGAKRLLLYPTLRVVQVEIRKGEGGTADAVCALMRQAGFSLAEKYRDESSRAADFLFHRT